ncbi:MAG: alanyl-tRNA editing protein [Pseudomonadales bacterium]
MTEALFREDAYRKECDATVSAANGDRVILDRTVCYPLGGGQPGDSGTLSWDSGNATIVDTRYTDDGSITHVLAEGDSIPQPGQNVLVQIDWNRRYRHMRMHTALHLLGAVLKYGVTGGNISADKSRLDFDMEDTIDKAVVQSALDALVAADHPVTTRWITDADLEAQPELVRTMSVQPPKGAGKIRLLEIENVDLQPCGGTHLQSTGEVGQVRIGKVEKKGQRNRRVNIFLDD